MAGEQRLQTIIIRISNKAATIGITSQQQITIRAKLSMVGGMKLSIVIIIIKKSTTVGETMPQFQITIIRTKITIVGETKPRFRII